MATRPRPLIAGNWKMNGRQADGLTLARALAVRAAHEPLAADLLLCPPATLLFLVAELLTDTPVALGAQDCHPKPSGAFTPMSPCKRRSPNWMESRGVLRWPIPPRTGTSNS